MKDNSKRTPQNQKSMNLTLILRRNQRVNVRDFSKNRNCEITKNKNKINSNYKSKLKLNAKRRQIRMKHNCNRIDLINRRNEGYS